MQVSRSLSNMSAKDADPSIHHFDDSSAQEKAHAMHNFIDVESEAKKGDLDDAVEVLQGQDLSFTQEEHDRVLRKIDWRIMPLAAWATGVQFVDKLGLGASATYGMRASVNLVGQDYSWCVTMFYFGYLAGSTVSTRILQRFHAGKVVACAFILWSTALFGMLGAQNFSQVMALRFLLGVFESASSPGLLLITTMWYTHKEQPLRFGIWNVTNGFLPIPFLLIYYGLGHTHSHVQALEPWRLIFLTIALVSFLTGVLVFFFLPDNPATVNWLTPHEKVIAVERVAKSQTGVKNAHFKWPQAREAFTDPRCWTVAGLMFFSQCIGNVTTNFLGVVITGFGYSPLASILLQIPNSAVQTVIQIAIAGPPTFIRRFRNLKQALMASVMIVAIVGVIILYVVTPHPSNKGLRLAGCILLAFSGGNLAVTMSVLGTNIGGFTKKQVTTSMTFFCYCAANFITPQTFLTSEAPRYHTGLAFVLAMSAAFVVLCGVSTVSMNRENARRDKLALTDPAYAAGDENTDILSGLRDLTDRSNGHHRYSA